MQDSQRERSAYNVVIYLDNASTTQVDPRVLDAMTPYLREQYGNPGSLHKMGQEATKAIGRAREQVADFINASPEEIIFTSGGTESNNMVIASASMCRNEDLIYSGIEHESIHHAIERYCGYKMYKYEIPPKTDGTINTSEIESVISPYFNSLVSVMYVNNETGAVNPVEEIGQLCKENNVMFHTDCVQAAGFQELDVEKIQCDMMSLSSHKIHGPKGMGALYVRDGIRNPHIGALIAGGEHQELGLRGGTENVAGIVGFGMACELTKKELKHSQEIISECKQAFYLKLIEELLANSAEPGIHVNGQPVVAPGKILSITVDGVDANSLVLAADAIGICISAGSACRSHEDTPSYVLTKMGLSEEQARNTIRVSFSSMNTPIECEYAAKCIADSIKLLRSINAVQRQN